MSLDADDVEEPVVAAEPGLSDVLAEAAQVETSGHTLDDEYFRVIAGARRVCAKYRPKFGRGRKGGLTLSEFQSLYGADPFYSWLGLDSPLMYAAHKAAGGMTSIYRQLGIGCEWIFRQVLRDSLSLNSEQSRWDYHVPLLDGRTRRLSLDGRIDLSDLPSSETQQRVRAWIDEASRRLLLPAELQTHLRGAVFEVRQGYKSKDSKRQNADISNSTNAYTEFYLPTIVLLSTQIDGDVASRYMQARWLLLTGSLTGPPTESAYSFCREVIGYDLAAFFERNSSRIRAELDAVLATLLEPSS